LFQVLLSSFVVDQEEDPPMNALAVSAVGATGVAVLLITATWFESGVVRLAQVFVS
jgi:hypothetical protein